MYPPPPPRAGPPPIARAEAGLPIGVQIVGPYLEDRTTLAFAERIEREFGGLALPAEFAH